MRKPVAALAVAMVMASTLAAETRQRSFELSYSQPLDSFIYPYAGIDGKPVSDIQREFFYEDLDLVAK